MSSLALALAALAATPAAQPRVIIYLHGAVVERAGPTGTDPRWGAYDWPGIVAGLRAPGNAVEADLRPDGTDVSAWADRVVVHVRTLIADGMPPSAITVVGASKGAVIASLISTRLRVRGVRYVLMGNCNDWLIRTWRPRLTGEVLSIYEASDRIGSSCAPLAAQSPALARFAEVRLTTGLGHGFLYRPLLAWLGPARNWAALGQRR